MVKNYYGHFQKLVSDATIDDILKITMGYQEASDSINTVNEWVKQNAKSNANVMEFDNIFSSCLTAIEALWFNLSWHIGWASGVILGLKAQGLDIPESISYLAVYNEGKYADK